MTLPSAGAGALAGFVATVAMSPVMSPRWTSRAPGQGGLQLFPPRRVVRRLEHAVAGSRTLATPTEQGLAWAAHAAYGCAAGAAYSLVRRAVPGGGPAGAGVLFGVGLWAMGYAGWVPLLGIREGTVAGRRSTIPFPLLAHAVYGLVLGVGHDRLTRTRPRD